MVFAYYQRLTPSQKRTYRRSDEVKVIHLSGAPALRPLVDRLATQLATGKPGTTRLAAQALLDNICGPPGLMPVRVRVLARRPSANWGELHGLYEPTDQSRPARITVWMRTAQRRQVVAFRTFLRTLLHELCHHLDYELLQLEDSFHTEGFYQRESSLFRQLMDPSQADTGHKHRAALS